MSCHICGREIDSDPRCTCAEDAIQLRRAFLRYFAASVAIHLSPFALICVRNYAEICVRNYAEAKAEAEEVLGINNNAE